MNKTVSVLLFIIAAIFAASCSSDNGGNDNKDKKQIKTIYVSVAPKMETPAGHDFAEGDVMYACNGSVGEKSLLSVLKYDEASGCFKGNFQYVADDDRINCYVVYANTSKVSVDTAARCITVDYQNQNGTLADAKARDYAYNRSATAANLRNSAQPLSLYNASAFLSIKKTDGVSPKAYRLASIGNRVATKESAIAAPLLFASLAKTYMNSNMFVVNEIEKISCNVNSDGDTYVAFHAQTIAKPTLECEITLENGVNIIENVDIDGSSAGSYGDAGIRTADFENGKTYTATATGKVSVGTFLCDDDFNVRAIVYDTENLNREQYGYGRAMAVNEAADNTSWSNAETLPSSASKYITSSVMTDLRGYEVSDYFKGNAENAAVNIAATYQNSLQGCSDWYLPSVGEWMNFWNNLGGMTKINILLRQAGAAELNGVKYWTASLRGLTDPYAIMENGGNLMPVAQPLHSKNGVRASVMF